MHSLLRPITTGSWDWPEHTHCRHIIMLELLLSGQGKSSLSLEAPCRLPTVAFSHLHRLTIHTCVTLLQIITVTATTITNTTMTTTLSVTMETVNPRTMSVMDMMTVVTTAMRKTAVLKVVHLVNLVMLSCV